MVSETDKENEWKQKLTNEHYEVCGMNGTELPWTGTAGLLYDCIREDIIRIGSK